MTRGISELTVKDRISLGLEVFSKRPANRGSGAANELGRVLLLLTLNSQSGAAGSHNPVGYSFGELLMLELGTPADQGLVDAKWFVGIREDTLRLDWEGFWRLCVVVVHFPPQCRSGRSLIILGRMSLDTHVRVPLEQHPVADIVSSMGLPDLLIWGDARYLRSLRRCWMVDGGE